MIPARYSHILFGLILSGLMSLMVSGLSTLRAVGPVAEDLRTGEAAPFVRIGFPLNHKIDTFTPAPLLGQHSKEVFMEKLGLTEEEAEALIASDAVNG